MRDQLTTKEGLEKTDFQNVTQENILGVILAAVAAVLCAAIDELLKEE